MAYFEDLSPYVCSRHLDTRPGVLNVGWLAPGHEFPKAPPSEELLDRLWTFCRCSVMPSRGIHRCLLCEAGTYAGERRDEKLLLGAAEIRVFANSGNVYAAPTLIFHYVEAHAYRPPEDFVRGLFEGPTPPSEKFFALVEARGWDWRRTSAPAPLMPPR